MNESSSRHLSIAAILVSCISALGTVAAAVFGYPAYSDFLRSNEAKASASFTQAANQTPRDGYVGTAPGDIDIDFTFTPQRSGDTPLLVVQENALGSSPGVFIPVPSILEEETMGGGPVYYSARFKAGTSKNDYTFTLYAVPPQFEGSARRVLNARQSGQVNGGSWSDLPSQLIGPLDSVIAYD